VNLDPRATPAARGGLPAARTPTGRPTDRKQ
jgi:hypothetical protein